MAAFTYIDCSGKGYTREKSRKKFRYKNIRGKYITDERVLERIASLVIPPAWTNVWICPHDKGHIQAYGYDQRERKQYIYHPEWTKARNSKKFEQVMGLERVLKSLKRRVNADLKLPDWKRDKTCALALFLTKATLMRVGNARYTKENKSYGLTTLQRKHLTFNGKAVTIQYIGKKGIEQKHIIRTAKLYRYLEQLYKLEGSNIFKYRSALNGSRLIKLKPKDINAYLATCCPDQNVTAKSFRIWGASIVAVQGLLKVWDRLENESPQKLLNEVVDKVATKLGNTRAVAKQYYIHPTVQEQFLNGKMFKTIGAKGYVKNPTKKNAERLFLKMVGI